MAKQVRPGLTNPARFKGRQESADLIRRQPAYPIRARGQAPLTEAECMAAISTCFNRNGKSAWQRGASMYEPATPTSRRVARRGARRQGDRPRAQGGA